MKRKINLKEKTNFEPQNFERLENKNDKLFLRKVNEIKKTFNLKENTWKKLKTGWKKSENIRKKIHNIPNWIYCATNECGSQNGPFSEAHIFDSAILKFRP